MRDPLNKTITTIQPSGIRKFFDVVHEMKDAISLGVGEPDFPTPEHVREAAIASIKRGETKYTDNRGTVELRAAAAEYLEKFGLHYDRENEILITMGASEGIDLALRALVDPGDEVLVVEPCYVSYIPCVELCGGIPVSIPLKAENKFRLTKEELEEKITDKTKVLLISFPNNPTGAIMEKEDLESIREVVTAHDIFVITDEIYAELTYGKKHASIAALPDMYDYLRSHPAADCGLGGPGMMSAIVNRNGGLQKGGLLEFVEPELILERMEDCVNPDLLDLREPEDLGYILRTLIILAVPVMYNGLRPGADPDGRKRLERVLQIVRRGKGAKPASAQQK